MQNEPPLHIVHNVEPARGTPKEAYDVVLPSVTLEFALGWTDLLLGDVEAI